MLTHLQYFYSKIKKGVILFEFYDTSINSGSQTALINRSVGLLHFQTEYPDPFHNSSTLKQYNHALFSD